MDVEHTGKDHSPTFECGICDLEVNTLEKLEIHIGSCEVYQFKFNLKVLVNSRSTSKK